MNVSVVESYVVATTGDFHTDDDDDDDDDDDNNNLDACNR